MCRGESTVSPGLALLEAAKWTLMPFLLHCKGRALPWQLCALHLTCAGSVLPRVTDAEYLAGAKKRVQRRNAGA